MMTDVTGSEPKKSKVAKVKRAGTRLPVVEWVNPTPKDADLAWLEENAERLTDLVLEMLDDFGDGEKLSVKQDSQSSRWMAIYFGGEGDSVHRGLALSVRGATPFDALCVLAYFHIVRYSRDWEVTLPSTSGRWG